MFIKHKFKDKITFYNLEKISQFEPYQDKIIRLIFDMDGNDDHLSFETKEERDEALEKISEGYRRLSKLCDLNKEGEE